MNSQLNDIEKAQCEIFPQETEAENLAQFLDQLDGSQMEIFNAFQDALERNVPLQMIVDAPAGYGKSTLAKAIAALFRSRRKIVVCCAWQAVAARAYKGGRTVHTTFGFSIEDDKNYVSKFEAQSLHAKLIAKTTLFIVDECFSLSSALFQGMLSTVRDFTGNIPQVFAGKCRLSQFAAQAAKKTQLLIQ